MPETSFSAERFESYRVGSFGDPLIAVAETGSTNLDALDRASIGDPEGTVVVADLQRSGRGRWGREWIGIPGGSLMFSVVLRPSSDEGLVTTALGVATCEAIEALTGLHCRLKWPNDVLIRGRKVAGILVESRSAAGRIQELVAGIGVNIDLAPGDLPAEMDETATSLATEMRADGERFPPSREQLLAAILTALEARYPVDPESLISEASSRSSVLGDEVTVAFSDGRSLTGTATRLTETGALEVTTAGGTVEVSGGEIEMLRPSSG